MSTLGSAGVAGVMAAWCAFALAFLTRRRAPGGRSESREPIAWAGTFLQAVALGLIFGFRRAPVGAPMLPSHPTLSDLLVLVCVVLAWLSVALMVWAIRVLGRQWAVAARLVEGHELITSGPYRLVRNPVYTGFFGLAIATAGVASMPWTLVVGAPLFLAGTLIRVRAEERLLRTRFGSRFDDFARRVPALVPGLRR